MLTLLSAISPGAGPAAADNYASANGSTTDCARSNAGVVNRTDPNPHTFFYQTLKAPTLNALEWARTQRMEPTSIQTSLLSSVNSLTDLVAYDQDYSTYCFFTWHPVGSVAGLTNCLSLDGNDACQQHDLRLDLSVINTTDVNYHNTMACHEVFHTWGLNHRGSQTSENGCMVASSPHAGELTLHDVTHINGATWIKPDYGNQNILNGQQMKSYDGRFRFVVQNDGNAVVYGTGPGCDSTSVCWHSGTNGHGTAVWAVIQGDGNFVIYKTTATGNVALCSSRTNGFPGSTLELQTDGNLVVYSPGHIARESSESFGGMCS